jgi:hypothetical protein
VTELSISVTAFVIDYIFDVNVASVLSVGELPEDSPDRLAVKAFDDQLNCRDGHQQARETA